MSTATRGVLGKVRRMIPPMLDKFHKGSFVKAPLNYPLAPAFATED